MKTIFHIITKEFIQFRRDRKMFGLSFVAPVFQLLILGYAANLDVSEIPLIILDQDRTRESRSLIANFTNTGYFKNVGYIERSDEIDHFLDDGHASFALVIPRGFGGKLAAGESSPLQLIADGSETTAGGIGVSYASIIISRFSQDVLLETLQRRGVTKLPPR
ncbi:MAG TPA: ABC transporter permease, partial [Bacteroidota bacterium]|nr:ABC transporter permease [Bacteroidota bacterium]